MKCTHCGAEGTGKICEYCGSELPYNGPQIQNTYQTENVTHHVTNIFYVNSADGIPSGRPAAPAPSRQPVYPAAPFFTPLTASDKSKSAALLLCWFLGILGAHLFYVGRWKKGLVYLFTGGIFGFGWLIDLIAIASNSFRDSEGRPLTGKAGKAWLIILAFILFAVITGGSSSGYC